MPALLLGKPSLGVGRGQAHFRASRGWGGPACKNVHNTSSLSGCMCALRCGVRRRVCAGLQALGSACVS